MSKNHCRPGETYRCAMKQRITPRIFKLRFLYLSNIAEQGVKRTIFKTHYASFLHKSYFEICNWKLQKGLSRHTITKKPIFSLSSVKYLIIGFVIAIGKSIKLLLCFNLLISLSLFDFNSFAEFPVRLMRIVLSGNWLSMAKISFKDSLKALEADIQHANTV